MKAIEAKGVTRTYGRGAGAFTAVNNVDFHVEVGELVALLGVNGAGKTSLVEVVEGLAPANSGQIAVMGHDPIRERAKVRAKTGIMLQEAGFAGALTVKETVRMWAGTLNRSRPVDEALELTDLAHRANVRVKALSGGERRRLDLALATLGNPEVLFLDEPTTGLDPASRRRTWELIRSMLDQGASVLLTTHYLEEAEALADRVLMMARGQIHAAGTVSEIVAAFPARISFRSEKAIDQASLAALPCLVEPVGVTRDRVELRSSNIQVTLGALLSLADERRVELRDLDARAASLEQAFLALNAA